jgi:hypothetical protein
MQRVAGSYPATRLRPNIAKPLEFRKEFVAVDNKRLFSKAYMAKKPKDELSDKEAERRATDALRRALSTTYRPQREMVCKKPPTQKRGATPKRTTRSETK